MAKLNRPLLPHGAHVRVPFGPGHTVDGRIVGIHDNCVSWDVLVARHLDGCGDFEHCTYYLDDPPAMPYPLEQVEILDAA